MSNYIISNEFLSVEIASKGAELQSIYNKQTLLEYMWSGDANFWGKKSPVLFPIVGGLKNDTYFYEEKPYTLNRHGFARESVYEVIYQDASSINFLLDANTDIKKKYPFNFEFFVQYEIKGYALFVTYFVKNTDEKILPFSVGAHPAFKVPLVDGTSFNDYHLLFSHTENAGRWPLSKDGLIETETISVLQSSQKLALTKELFYEDALVFKELKSTGISIVSDKTKHGLKVEFNNFPFMGIWSAKDADFVCIEPWCGIADSVNTTQQLLEKEGIIILEQQETFSVTWSVEVF